VEERGVGRLSVAGARQPYVSTCPCNIAHTTNTFALHSAWSICLATLLLHMLVSSDEEGAALLMLGMCRPAQTRAPRPSAAPASKCAACRWRALRGVLRAQTSSGRSALAKAAWPSLQLEQHDSRCRPPLPRCGRKSRLRHASRAPRGAQTRGRAAGIRGSAQIVRCVRARARGE
jgi:hypothetical protein